MARTYHILGVPLRSGSYYPGNENDARGYRDAQLLEKLHSAGVNVRDAGDVAIPSYLPHHTVPPIRSWPGPRIAWECVGERVRPYLQQPEQVPFLIGCDCSVVVGTTQALRSVAGENVHVLYVDGDFDDAPPDPERCQSAAAMAMWLLTNGLPFQGPPLPASRVTVIGATEPSQSTPPMSGLSLEEVRRSGARDVAQRALAAIPSSASILLHFDTDVFRAEDMPAAYFTHADGITMSEGRELFQVLANDSRVRLIEVSEYASLRDGDSRYAGMLVEMFASGLGQGAMS
jgi:arginase